MTVMELLVVATLDFKNSMFVRYNNHTYHIDNTKSEWMDFEVKKIHCMKNPNTGRIETIIYV